MSLQVGRQLHGVVAGTVDPWRPPAATPASLWEFCWSARKLFDRLGIAYRSVDLDSVACQSDDLGGRIRAVLRRRTGAPTIPQICVGGERT